MPATVPGAAASPGARICNLANVPALTAIDGLVLLALLMSLLSAAVSIALPAVFKVTLKIWAPLASAVPPGGIALLSVEVMPTVSLTVLTRFQFASTALTVTLNAAPAVRAVGVPVLPLPVPGAAVSPGVSSWSLVKAAGLTTMLLEVALVKLPLLNTIVIVSANG